MIKVNLHLFKINYKAGKKEIVAYKYPTMTKELLGKIESGIKLFEEKISEYEIVPYDPLIEHKEKLQSIPLENVMKDSTQFEVIHQYLITDESAENDKAKLEIKETNKEFLDSASLYVIEHDKKFYFRKFFNNAYLKKTKIVAAYDSKAESIDMIKEKLMILETTFDMILEEDGSQVTINNSTNFEYIAGYDAFFTDKRTNVMEYIKSENILENYNDFEKEGLKKKYLRLFSKVKVENIESLKKNTAFLDKLEKETANQITYNKTSGKFKVETKHTKTILHLFTFLIGIDMTDRMFIHSDKEYIKVI